MEFHLTVFGTTECNIHELLKETQTNLTTLEIAVTGLAMSCSKEHICLFFVVCLHLEAEAKAKME